MNDREDIATSFTFWDYSYLITVFNTQVISIPFIFNSSVMEYIELLCDEIRRRSMQTTEKQIGIIYLVHLEKPIGTPDPYREERGRPPRKKEYKPHARHYIGWTVNLDDRIREHRTGATDSAALLRAANAEGIGWDVVKTWVGTRDYERKLKNQKNAPRMCPECQKNHG